MHVEVESDEVVTENVQLSVQPFYDPITRVCRYNTPRRANLSVRIPDEKLTNDPVWMVCV